jgi:hypothetical protein
VIQMGLAPRTSQQRSEHARQERPNIESPNLRGLHTVLWFRFVMTRVVRLMSTRRGAADIDSARCGEA